MPVMPAAPKPTTQYPVTSTKTPSSAPQPPTPESEPEETLEVPEMEGEAEALPVEEAREIIYPEYQVHLCVGQNAMTYMRMMELMGWEDEDAYRLRMKGTVSGSSDKKEKATAGGFGENFLLKDFDGNKVQCWYNTKNRPLDVNWCKALAQTILKSGPGLKEELRDWQFNGESFIVGEYGQVLSGQHRGCGFILAVQQWRKEQKKWKHIWPTEPTLEMLVVTGVKERQSTIRTLDITKPRSLADTFYTSDLFNKMSPSDKREASRMLGAGLDLLWKRTGTSDLVKYQTHGESADFLERHKKLLEMVFDVFQENKDRAVSKLQISPGQFSALMYLFAASKTDRKVYEEKRTEKYINFDNWETARGYLVSLVSTSPSANSHTKAVREALARIVDVGNKIAGETLGGRVIEKNAILIKGWNAFSANGVVTDEDVDISEHYQQKDGGGLEFINPPLVGGIDVGEEKVEDAEEIKKEAEKQKAANTAALEKKVEEKKAATKPPTKSLKDEAADGAAKIRAQMEAKKAAAAAAQAKVQQQKK